MNSVVQNLVRFAVQWSSKMGSFPVRWNNRTKLIEEMPKGFQYRWKWNLAKCMELLHLVYLVIVAVTILRGPEDQLKNIGEILFKLIEVMMRLCVRVNFSRNVEDSIYFPNCVTRSLQKFEDKYKVVITSKRPGKPFTKRVSPVPTPTPPPSPTSKSLQFSDKILFNVASSFVMYPFLGLGHNLMFPEKPLYISHLVYLFNTKVFKWTYIPIAILNFWLSSVVWSGALYVTFCTLPHVIAIIRILDEIRWKPSKNLYKTKSSLRQPKGLCITMRQIQIMFTILYSIFRGNFLAMKFLVMYYFIASVNIIAACRTVLPKATILLCTMSSCGCVAAILLMFILFGSVYMRTEKCLNSWRNFSWNTKRDRMLMKKFRKSVYPVQFHNGSYVVRPKRVLTYLNSLIWSCLKSLITL